MEALAEANSQLYWGTKVGEIERAVQVLHALGLNLVLADRLASKARQMIAK